MGAIFSAPVQTGPAAHPASCTMDTGSFPGIKSGRGVTVSTYPLLVPWSRKSKAIPLLPLWAVRPVQSLSACIRAHFTFFFFLTLTRREVTHAQKLAVTYTAHSMELERTHFMVVDTNVSTVYRIELPPSFPSVSTC